MTIPVATGSIHADDLGVTLMHEHVFVLSPEIDQDYPEFVHWDERLKTAEAIRKLQEAKAAGVDTIVDLTVLGMGRNVERVRGISEASGVNIVVASGLFTFDALPHFLRHVGPGGTVDCADPMIEMFIKDATVGIGDSGIKAGVYKCVTDKLGVTPGIDRVLRAVARAHRETGVPISTHTDPLSRRGLEQQDIFEEEGVDLSRVVIGHSGDSTDLDYLRILADRGSYLGMDRFGLDRGGHTSFEERVETVAQLCAEGYSGQIVLSHDASCWDDWLPPELTAGTNMEMPDWTFTHISTDVLPALRNRGVTDRQIAQMLVDNPKQILATR